jgi:hypothetical protein
LPGVFKALEDKIGINDETLYSRLGRIFFKNFEKDEKDKIEELL